MPVNTKTQPIWVKRGSESLVVLGIQILSSELYSIEQTGIFQLLGLKSMEFPLQKIIQSISNMTSLNETTQLGSIYPDVNGQLCNKHVKKLSQLKTLFKDIYGDMEPQGYVLANGVAKMVDLGQDMQLSFALENGVTVLYSKTYINEELFINGNHMQEELIFNSKGKHEDGIHQKIDQIKKLLRLIRKGSGVQKDFFGGIIYVHSNIGENLFGFQQCLMTGLALAMLLIYEELPNYTQESLVQLLGQADGKLSKGIISNLIKKYSLNNMVLQTSLNEPKKQQDQYIINVINPNSDRSIVNYLANQCVKHSGHSLRTAEDQYLSENNLDSDYSSSFGSIQKIQNGPIQELRYLQVNLKDNHKLVFCKLDISKQQEEEYSYKMQNIHKISEFLQEQGMARSQLINQSGQVVLPQILKDAIGQDWILVEYCEQMRNLLSLLACQNIQFQQFIRLKYELDREYDIYDDQVDEILSKLQANNKYIQNFCIIEGQILVISMDKQYYAEVMVFLRKLLNQSQLSTYRYLATSKKTDQEIRLNDISEIMFTAMPSAGYAIYKPSQQEDFWI